MSTAATAKRPDAALTLRPVEGRPDVFVVSPEGDFRGAGSPGSKRRLRELSEEDWDKFEKDIADAFERIP